MKRFELHILPVGGLKLTEDSGEVDIWGEKASADGLFVRLKTPAVSLFNTGAINCGWESYTREGVCRKQRGLHSWSTPCTSTATTTNTATNFEGAHHNAFGQFISVVRDNEWYYVPYGTYSTSTVSPNYELHTAVKLMGTATATIAGTSTTTATVTSTAGTYPCFALYGAYTMMSSIDCVPWKWAIGDATPTPLITSGNMYKFKFLATFYDTIFGAFSNAGAGAIDIRYSQTLPTMTALDFPAANQLWKPDDDYGITGLVPFGRKALLLFGRKSMLAIDYYAGYKPPFEIQQILNGIGTSDHKSVVVAVDSVYFYDRDRAAIFEYAGGGTVVEVSKSVRSLLEDRSIYNIDVVGWYDSRYDMVSWSLRSASLGYYDFSTDNIATQTSTLASNPFANLVLSYHRATKRWFINSQTSLSATTGYEDAVFCKIPISRVAANQRSDMVVIPNYANQLMYEIDEYYVEQTGSYPMTRAEPVLWYPYEERHKRINEVRVLFGADVDIPLKDNFTATPTATSPTLAMSCYYGDHKHLTKTNATLISLGTGTVDSNNECIFYTDFVAKYYQFVWGQTSTIANGLDCPVSKIIVKGFVY